MRWTDIERTLWFSDGDFSTNSQLWDHGRSVNDKGDIKIRKGISENIALWSEKKLKGRRKQRNEQPDGMKPLLAWGVTEYSDAEKILTPGSGSGLYRGERGIDRGGYVPATAGGRSLALRATGRGAPTYRRSTGVRRSLTLHTTGTKGHRNDRLNFRATRLLWRWDSIRVVD